jgi:hypothetical protein
MVHYSGSKSSGPRDSPHRFHAGGHLIPDGAIDLNVFMTLCMIISSIPESFIDAMDARR